MEIETTEMPKLTLNPLLLCEGKCNDLIRALKEEEQEVTAHYFWAATNKYSPDKSIFLGANLIYKCKKCGHPRKWGVVSEKWNGGVYAR